MDVYSTLVVGVELVNDYGSNVETLEKFAAKYWDTDAWGDIADVGIYDHIETLAFELSKKLDFELAVINVGYCESGVYVLGIAKTEVSTCWEVCKLDKKEYQYMPAQQEQLKLLVKELEELGFELDEDYCGLLLVPYFSH
jgi:hypothetical protein